MSEEVLHTFVDLCYTRSKWGVGGRRGFILACTWPLQHPALLSEVWALLCALFLFSGLSLFSVLWPQVVFVANFTGGRLPSGEGKPRLLSLPHPPHLPLSGLEAFKPGMAVCCSTLFFPGPRLTQSNTVCAVTLQLLTLKEHREAECCWGRPGVTLLAFILVSATPTPTGLKSLALFLVS